MTGLKTMWLGVDGVTKELDRIAERYCGKQRKKPKT